MKRLKALILLFCVSLSVPVTYVVWRTYRGVAAEEQSQLRFFAATMLDDMETEMAALVQLEEDRAVDEYQYTLAPGGGHGGARRSPLATLPEETYIIGYLQNGPDGSFETPLLPDNADPPAAYQPVVAQLKAINRKFNAKKFTIPAKPSLPTFSQHRAMEQKAKGDVFSDRFFTAREQKTSRDYLGQQKTRIEEITPQQALNITKKEKSRLKTAPMAESESNAAADSNADSKDRDMEMATGAQPRTDTLSTLWSRGGSDGNPASESLPSIPPTDRFQAEVAPLQSVFIDSDAVFIFRRVVIDNQIYRQGFVLKVSAFLRHLSRQHFIRQPMAAFTGLRLRIRDNGQGKEMIRSGVMDAAMPTITARIFPAPFDWFTALVTGDRVPASPVRQGLTLALLGLGLVLLLGMFAIYRSARAVMLYAERRQQFVSSVTHELKTPLTNIRMYVEMLEQGIAPTPEREQAYLKILNSESARLSGLINNVLELSKLEKKQRHFNYQEGRIADVFEAVRRVMANPLARAGFTLSVAADHVPVFSFDQEVLVQVLCNLVENSIKFGRSADVRQIAIRAELSSGWVDIHVSDTGPGIPKKELGRVFDDFYRVDNDLTRNAGGTGIGLALVKKFVVAMGGRVSAANNDGPGCTIVIRLPGQV